MYTLSKLAYPFDALEPYIDARTMEIHHDKHHATYVSKLNDALVAHPELSEKPIEELLKHLSSLPKDIIIPVKNFGGGHAAHTLWWEIISPSTGTKPAGAFLSAINASFKDTTLFKESFIKAGVQLFGSGWVWLVTDASGTVSIVSLPNQDNPLSIGLTPLMCLDVWEHAYYLKFQNKRNEFAESWWNVINWEVVTKKYEERNK